MLLADMGADVIKVEPPGGEPDRSIGPYYHDESNPERSLFWFAYNRNKRGVTLDIETAKGRDIFKRLVKTADMVIETFNPGYMSSLGLGYDDLAKINPGVIMVSISDWGQTGPYVDKGYKADQMILWAMGGEMYLAGDPDRAPLQISFPQPYFHAAAQAAVGSLVALYYREATGEGQHVDVSIQACLPSINLNATSYYELEGLIMSRGAQKTGRPRVDGKILPNKNLWRCKDGYVIGNVVGGSIAALLQSSKALTAWMKEEGMAGDLVDIDWANLDSEKVEPNFMLHIHEQVANFIKTKTVAEFYDEAIKRRMTFASVNDPHHIATSPQLRARGFFVSIEHPELDDKLTYLGPLAKFSATPLKRWFRSPLIGEHNEEIYEEELGMPKQEVSALQAAGVI